MTISEGEGNLLDANVDALVNTVNIVGIMGKGIALQFKRAYPEMFEEYKRLVADHTVKLGTVNVWPTGQITGPRYVINFPTKGHWRAMSHIGDIRAGLIDLVATVRDLAITSIAIPPLGCGNGGLLWSEVKPLIYSASREMPEVDVLVFPPSATAGAAVPGAV